MTDHSPDDNYVVRPNKSQLKRDMAELKALGERIIALPPATRAQLPLSPELLAAIKEDSRITSREARRRHLQYIGKLMRSEDLEGIREIFQRLERERQGRDLMFHRLERWRDRLIEEGDPVVTEFVEHYPSVDLQMLRQLIRNARREREQNRPPASARRLFQLIREAAAPT